MLDTIRFQVPEERLPGWLRAEFASQLAAVPLASAGGLPTQRRTSVTVGNINLRVNSAGIVVVENSLHRFYKGHNGGTFTRAEIGAALFKLSEALGFDVRPCQLLRADVGANVALASPQAVTQALTALSDYKGKPFHKTERGKDVTGAKRLLVEFDFKFYDKSREVLSKYLVKLPAPTLRIELAARKLIYVRRFGATTVRELATPAFYKAAGDELLARLGACTFTETLNWSLLTLDELEAVALTQNLPAFAVYKANRANKNRVTRRRRLAEQALHRATVTGTKSTLLEGLREAILQSG